MEILPLVKLHLSRGGFERHAELRPKIKRPQSDFPIELPKFGQCFIRCTDGLFLCSLDGFPQNAARPEQKGRRFEIPAELFLTKLGDISSDRVQFQQLLDVEGLSKHT